jgi:diguanylate cyclase (GGDEF)-like protein
MTQNVTLPNGSNIAFPDGMTPADMNSAIYTAFPQYAPEQTVFQTAQKALKAAVTPSPDVSVMAQPTQVSSGQIKNAPNLNVPDTGIGFDQNGISDTTSRATTQAIVNQLPPEPTSLGANSAALEPDYVTPKPVPESSFVKGAKILNYAATGVTQTPLATKSAAQEMSAVPDQSLALARDSQNASSSVANRYAAFQGTPDEIATQFRNEDLRRSYPNVADITLGLADTAKSMGRSAEDLLASMVDPASKSDLGGLTKNPGETAANTISENNRLDVSPARYTSNTLAGKVASDVLPLVPAVASFFIPGIGEVVGTAILTGQFGWSAGKEAIDSGKSLGNAQLKTIAQGALGSSLGGVVTGGATKVLTHLPLVGDAFVPAAADTIAQYGKRMLQGSAGMAAFVPLTTALNQGIDIATGQQEDQSKYSYSPSLDSLILGALMPVPHATRDYIQRNVLPEKNIVLSNGDTAMSHSYGAVFSGEKPALEFINANGLQNGYEPKGVAINGKFVGWVVKAKDLPQEDIPTLNEVSGTAPPEPIPTLHEAVGGTPSGNQDVNSQMANAFRQAQVDAVYKQVEAQKNLTENEAWNLNTAADQVAKISQPNFPTSELQTVMQGEKNVTGNTTILSEVPTKSTGSEVNNLGGSTPNGVLGHDTHGVGSGVDNGRMDQQGLKAILDSVKTESSQVPNERSQTELNRRVEQVQVPQDQRTSVERRHDEIMRMQVSQMTPEELRHTILHDQLTGLPNARAYDESAKQSHVAFLEANGLKAINDTFGHEAGDRFLQAVGKALATKTSERTVSYHRSGDKFLIDGPDERTLNAAISAVRRELKKTSLDVQTATGEKATLKGITVAAGIGKDVASAETRMMADKERQKAAGVAARGEKPKELIFKGEQVQQGVKPAEKGVQTQGIEGTQPIQSLRPIIEGMIRNKTVASRPNKAGQRLDLAPAIERAKEIMSGTRTASPAEISWWTRTAKRFEAIDAPSGESARKIVALLKSGKPVETETAREQLNKAVNELPGKPSSEKTKTVEEATAQLNLQNSVSEKSVSVSPEQTANREKVIAQVKADHPSWAESIDQLLAKGKLVLGTEQENLQRAAEMLAQKNGTTVQHELARLRSATQQSITVIRAKSEDEAQKIASEVGGRVGSDLQGWKVETSTPVSPSQFSKIISRSVGISPDEITTNPSAKTLLGLLNRVEKTTRTPELRGLMDDNGNLHVWFAYDTIHREGAKAAGIPYDYTKRLIITKKDGMPYFHFIDLGVNKSDLARYFTDKVLFDVPGSGIDSGIEYAKTYKLDAESSDKLLQDLGIQPLQYSKNQMGFYSQLKNAIDSASDKIFTTGRQVKSWLDANAGKLGVKKDEIFWTGLNNYLDAQKGKVSKADVQSLLEGNGVQFKEVTLGGEGAKPKPYTVEQDGNDWNVLDHNQPAFPNGRVADGPFADEFDAKSRADILNDDIENGDYVGWTTTPTMGTTKYSAYAPDGVKNYREILWSFAEKSDSPEGIAKRKAVFDLYAPRLAELYKTSTDYAGTDERIRERDNARTQHRMLSATRNKAADEAYTLMADRKSELQYKDPHWDIPTNIWARVSDGVDTEGNTVLVVHEFQSGHGQKGKRIGFANPQDAQVAKEKSEALRSSFNEANDAERFAEAELHKQQLNLLHKMGLKSYSEIILSGDRRTELTNEYRELQETDKDYYNAHAALESARRKTSDIASEMGELERAGDQGDKPPRAPFVTDTKSWTAFALKRVIILAVEGNYNKVAWDTGEQQADRYNLAHQLQKITAIKRGDTFQILGIGTDGQSHNFGDHTVAELPNVVGKELAEKIANQEMPNEVYAGNDLKIGGEGMKGYYDQIVPQVANEILKKVGGGKTGSVNVGLIHNIDNISGEMVMNNLGIHESQQDNYWHKLTYRERTQAIESFRTSLENQAQRQGFTITPELRAKVQSEGLPLFSKQNTFTPGFYSPELGTAFVNHDTVSTKDASAIILHEMTHAADTKTHPTDTDGRMTIVGKQVVTRMNTPGVAGLPVYARVWDRMVNAGETNNPREALNYLVEETLNDAKRFGYSRLDSGFMGWLQRQGFAVSQPVKQWIANIRAAMYEHGISVKVEDLTVDDMIAVATRGMKRIAEGKQEAAGLENKAIGLENKAILNVGLDIPGGGKLNPEDVVKSIERLGVKVLSTNLHQSNTELTLVPRLSRPLTKDEVYQLSVEHKQDAIAQRLPNGTGFLAGPKAADWGDYNPEYFKMPDGQWASNVDVLKTSEAGSKFGLVPTFIQQSKKESDQPKTFNDVKQTIENLAGMVKNTKNVQSVLNGTTGAWDGLQRAFAPQYRSPEAREISRILIEGLGTKEMQGIQFRAKLNAAVKVNDEKLTLGEKARDILQKGLTVSADKLFVGKPKEENYAFMQAMDIGDEKYFADHPEMKSAAAIIGKMFSDKAREVQELGTGALETVREDYFPHIWNREPSGDTQRQIMTSLSKRPFEGQKGFTKQRVFDDFAAGIRAGLEPVTTNPLDLVLLKMEEMDKYILAHRILRTIAENSDAVTLIKAGDKKPVGYEDVNGRYGFITIGNEKLRYVAREDVAQVVNNYLSPSLYHNKYVGHIFSGSMTAANTLNQFQLGVFSAFHAGFTSFESVISHAAVGIKALSGGDFKSAAKYLGTAPAAWINNPRLGNKIVEEMLNKGSHPEMAQIIQGLQMAGFKWQMDTRFRTDSTKKMLDSWAEGRPVSSATHAVNAVVEQSARPILEWLVPRQKFGVFGEMYNKWIESNPNATHEELRNSAQQIWNRVDSRLGQVVYTRLFMHNFTKNFTQLLLRAPGWTGGTILEVGGGMKDLVKYMGTLATGNNPGEITDRAAYTLSMLLVTSIANATLTYLFTGTPPKDWKDLVAFRTGNVDEHGRPERFMLPTYMKDVYAYAHAPVKTLLHKSHPLLSVVSDIARNRDYYGTEIRNEDDSILHQIGDSLGYVASAFVPFWMKGVQKEHQRGGSLLTEAMPLVGVMPAPSDINKTPAELLMGEYSADRLPQGARTQAQAAKSAAERDIYNALRKNDTATALQLYQKDQAKGILSPQDYMAVAKSSEQDYLVNTFNKLTYEQAVRVMAVANKDEKKKLAFVFARKKALHLQNGGKL